MDASQQFLIPLFGRIGVPRFLLEDGVGVVLLEGGSDLLRERKCEAGAVSRFLLEDGVGLMLVEGISGGYLAMEVV